MTIERWLAQAGEGDRASFDALVRATAPAVWTVVRRLTVDEATAEDALQETFTALWQAAPHFEGRGSANAFIYGIARNKAAKTWRRRAGEPRTTEPLAGLAVEAGWGADPEQVAARAEQRTLLLNAIATLTMDDQDLISRCDLEGVDPHEVAAELGIAPGTLRVRLHRARLRLMRSLYVGVSNE